MGLNDCREITIVLIKSIQLHYYINIENKTMHITAKQLKFDTLCQFFIL